MTDTPQHSQILLKPSISSRKRKWEQEEQGAEYLFCRHQSPSKRSQNSPHCGNSAAGLREEKKWKEGTSDLNEETFHPLQYWILTMRWPKEYFEQNSEIRKDLERDNWLEGKIETSTPRIQYIEVNGLRLPCPIKKVPTSLRRKQSDSSMNESSDQKIGREKAFHIASYSTSLRLKANGAIFINQIWVSQKKVKTFISVFWNLNRLFPRIHGFATIYSKQPAAK